jgi:hypothetical protein
MSTTVLTGGCHCGALRYEAREPPVDTGYCHCSICRRTTGAPVLAWASVPVGGFSYVRGAPAIYRSSEWGQREFCATCGTQICFRQSRDATTVDLNTGSLDEPERCPPQMHIYHADRIAWFETADALPRHPGRKDPRDGGG